MNLASQPSSEQWQAFEDYLREQVPTAALSGTVLVAKDDRLIVKQAYLGNPRQAEPAPNTPPRTPTSCAGTKRTR
jgi:hypothetical protein